MMLLPCSATICGTCAAMPRGTSSESHQTDVVGYSTLRHAVGTSRPSRCS